MKNNVVWTFTNQRELNKGEFISYFERKVFMTIRKFEMLPKDRTLRLKKSGSLNTHVLKNVLEKKFKVEFSSKPNFSEDNLSDFAERIFSEVLNGKFSKIEKINAPLYFLSNKEVELYAQLVGIKGKKHRGDKAVQRIFNEFFEKNPDLEHNIVNAAGQLG